MSILKTAPVFEIHKGDYSKPRRIIVAGSYEKIGFDLSTIAKKHYYCALGIYDVPISDHGSIGSNQGHSRLKHAIAIYR